MTEPKIPPHRRKRPPSPKTHARPAGDPLVVAHYNEAAATDGAGTEDDAAQVQALQKVLGPLNLPTLSAAQQQRVGELCRECGLASDGVASVESTLRFAMAIRQTAAQHVRTARGRKAFDKLGPAAQHARTARGRKPFDELSAAARNFAGALDALDTRSLIKVLGVSPLGPMVGPDFSGADRWQIIQFMRGFVNAMAQGAKVVAPMMAGKAGAPSTPEYLLVAIENLAAIWERYGPARPHDWEMGTMVPPRATQNRKKKGQYFHFWAQALVMGVACFATEAEVNTAIGQVVADRRSQAERADAGLAASSADR